MRKRYIAIAALLLGQAAPAFSQEGPFVDGFDDGVLSESRYNIRTNNDNSTIVVDNGMLRLQATSDGITSARAALDLVNPTNFIEAEVTLDSSSMAEGTGLSRVVVSGVFYNDQTPSGVVDGGSLGDVLVQLSLRLRGDGTLSNLVCAFRSNDDDFGDITTIVIDGFTECGEFTTEIEFDVPYTASIFLDQVNRKLVFKLNGETIDHVITGNIFEPSSRAVASVLALSRGIGSSIAFADNISNSVVGVPGVSTTTDETVDETTDETTGGTTDETTDEIIDETTDESTEETTGEMAGDTTGDTTDDTTDETTDGSTDDATITGGTTDDTTGDTTVDDIIGESTGSVVANDDIIGDDSSSGCSIGGTSVSNDPMFILLTALALLMIGLRRTPLRRLLRAPDVAGEAAAIG